jgi:hypothetical protein
MHFGKSRDAHIRPSSRIFEEAFKEEDSRRKVGEERGRGFICDSVAIARPNLACGQALFCSSFSLA